MKIDIACGGTGGHLLPGIVTGHELRRRGHDITLWVTGREVERAMTGEWDGAVETVPGRGAVAAISGIISCRKTMRSSRPAVLLAMGGYGSVGPAIAARLLGVPVVLHEANVVPGRAMRLLARFAAEVGVAFEDAVSRVPHSRVSVTGMPIRPELAALSPVEASWPDSLTGAGLTPDRWTLLVLGGSQGAQRLNELLPGVAGLVDQGGGELQVIHLAGDRDRESVDAAYREAGVSAAVFAFHNNMQELYALADYAVCRAGAGTCAELQAIGLPVLLIPYPHARDDHQLANAQAVVTLDHIEIALEAELDEQQFAEILQKRVGRGKTGSRARLERAESLHHGASGRLADLVENVA